MTPVIYDTALELEVETVGTILTAHGLQVDRHVLADDEDGLTIGDVRHRTIVPSRAQWRLLKPGAGPRAVATLLATVDIPPGHDVGALAVLLARVAAGEFGPPSDAPAPRPGTPARLSPLA